MVDKAEFAKLVNSHDLTYTYSDDGRAYRRGADQHAKIKELAKSLPEDFVRETWNKMVDTRLAEGFREQFYWR